MTVAAIALTACDTTGIHRIPEPTTLPPKDIHQTCTELQNEMFALTSRLKINENNKAYNKEYGLTPKNYTKKLYGEFSNLFEKPSIEKELNAYKAEIKILSDRIKSKDCKF